MNLKLCESDYKFMSIIWENEPIRSGKLVELCASRLNWKKSTTYTMIKKLSEKGLLKNENGTVVSLISQKNVQSFESEYVVNNKFGGSLPAFIASFMRTKKLTEKEAEEIRHLIDNTAEDVQW